MAKQKNSKRQMEESKKKGDHVRGRLHTQMNPPVSASERLHLAHSPVFDLEGLVNPALVIGTGCQNASITGAERLLFYANVLCDSL